MPPLPAVPNVLKAAVQWSVSSDVDVRTGLFFEYSGTAPNSSNCQSLANTIYTAFQTFAEDWDDDTTLTGCEVTDLSSSSGGVGEHAGSAPGTLTVPLSGASCMLVNYTIARRYRGGRPRSYLPWGDASKVGNRQTWNAGFVSTVEGHLATIFGDIIGASAGGTTITNHVNVSYYEGFTAVENPITHRWRNVPTLRSSPLVDTIAGFTVATKIANQRRRG